MALAPGWLTELANLYYLSGTIQFGSFELAAHRANPGLEKSPIYMHFPKKGEPGSEHLERMFWLIGALFANRVEMRTQPIYFERMAGIPNGASPLADQLRFRIPGPPDRLLIFDKHVNNGGQARFELASRTYRQDDRLLVVDDHTSGGHSKAVFIEAAREAGFQVGHVLTVVDRQQGGKERLKSLGVQLHALMTLDELLDHGLMYAKVSAAAVRRVRAYIARNQLWPPQS